MPTSLAGHCALRNLDGIYVIGTNLQANLQVFLLNITTSTWTTFYNNHTDLLLTAGRRDFACSFNQDKSLIFISGGRLDNGETTSDFLAFSLQSKNWKPLQSSLRPRSGHVMTSYRGFPTIVWGVDSDGNSLTSMESYIEEENTWDELNDHLTNGRKNFRVTRVPSSYLPQNWRENVN